MAVDDAAFVASLSALLVRVDLPLESDQQLADRLGEVLGAATQVLGVDSVGLMLLDEHDVLRVVGTTDAASAALEAAQLQLGRGPAIDCVDGGRSIAVADLAASADYAAVWQWLQTPRDRSADGGSAVRPAGGGAGVGSVLSVPVRARGEIIGTLNALHRCPQSWDDARVRAVEAYAGLIGVLLRLGAAADGDGDQAQRDGSPGPRLLSEDQR